MARLQFTQVSRVFGEDPPITALAGVDLTIAEGAYLAIEGPSGSGKSTLLNHLALVDLPSSGEYQIDNQAVSGLSERQRARLRSDTFGFVFQRFHLMPRRTALENVEIGLLYRGVRRTQRRELAQQALAAVGLATRQDVAARKLSGGEQQRVAIARATLGNTPVVVADEPTGNLDSQAGSGIIDQLEELHRRGSTVVVVTHDPAIAARANQRVRLRDGRIITNDDADDDGRQAAGRDHISEEPPATGHRLSVPGHASTMRLQDLGRESWHALRDRPGRTALLVAAVAVAVALVVVTLGLSQTAAAQVSSSFDIQRNHEVTITVPTAMAGASTISGVPRDVETRLRQVRGLTQAGVLERHDPLTATNPGQPPVTGINLVGVSPGLLAAVGASVEWAPGHPHSLGRHEILIGTFAAGDLAIGPLQLDPVITISGTTYGVAGIITGADRTPELSADIAVAWQYASELSQLDASTVYLTTVGGAAQQDAQQAPLAIDPVHADQMQVQAPPDPTTLPAAIQSDVRSTLLALTIVAALASILGVANAMLLGVIERIGELGLRRAIGARPVHILSQTSVEAVFAGLLGGIVGLTFGLGAVLAATLKNHWQPVLDLRLVPLAVAGGIIVGTLGGLPASLRASRIQPADALRR
jgi:macrolide transport system ATP-binding/permease protein